MYVLNMSWQWLYIFPDAMREILTGGTHTKAMRGGDMQRGTHATAHLPHHNAELGIYTCMGWHIQA